MEKNNKKKNQKKQSVLTTFTKILLIIVLIPATFAIYYMTFLAWQELKELPIFEQFAQPSEIEQIQANFDIAMPEEYIPIYITAGERYGVPWTLIAAHHRIETRFSTMKTDISPVGAEGPLQFMPCTWVGWQHDTCNGLGEGKITEAEKMNPSVIAKYGGYGVDANGDGVANPFDIADAIHSAAHFLANEGAASGQIEQAVFQYNHSDEYVEDVLYYYELYNTYKDSLEVLITTARI